MKRNFRKAISVTMSLVLMIVSPLVVKAASINGTFTGGNYYGTLTVSSTTAKTTLSAAYEEDGIPDPYVKTEGTVKNLAGHTIATLNSGPNRGYCSISHNQLSGVYSASVKIYVVNMNSFLLEYSTSVYG